NARAGIDAHDPQGAEITLAGLAIAVLVLAGLGHRLLRDPEALAALAVVPLGLLQDFLVTRTGGHAALDSCHESPPYAYGSILRTAFTSLSATISVERRWR